MIKENISFLTFWLIILSTSGAIVSGYLIDKKGYGSLFYFNFINILIR